MITHLGQLHPQHMSVILLTPGYAAATLDRLAKDIRADYVLQGSIRQIANRMTASAQLVQVSSQTAVRGHTYERDVNELLRVQVLVSAAITGDVFSNLPLIAPA